jgi:hypothetical protein
MKQYLYAVLEKAAKPQDKKYTTEDSGKVMKVLQKVVKPEPVKN